MNNRQKNSYVRRQILQALLAMMEEQDFPAISVSALTARAGVGRASFYRNFTGKEDVLRQEAARLTREMDDSRVRYHKYYTHLRWGDSSDYDLCFDSVRLGTDKSVALIERYIEGIGL